MQPKGISKKKYQKQTCINKYHLHLYTIGILSDYQHQKVPFRGSLK